MSRQWDGVTAGTRELPGWPYGARSARLFRMRDFHPYGFRLDNQDHLVVWFTPDAEPDGVVINDGRLVAHSDLDGLYDYARLRGFQLVDDAELNWVDLDAIAFWTVVGDEIEPDCVEL